MTDAERRLIAEEGNIKELLEKVDDVVDDYVDVRDGPNGEARPNWAMSLQGEIRNLLARLGGKRYK